MCLRVCSLPGANDGIIRYLPSSLGNWCLNLYANPERANTSIVLRWVVRHGDPYSWIIVVLTGPNGRTSVTVTQRFVWLRWGDTGWGDGVSGLQSHSLIKEAVATSLSLFTCGLFAHLFLPVVVTCNCNMLAVVWCNRQVTDSFFKPAISSWPCEQLGEVSRVMTVWWGKEILFILSVAVYQYSNLN